MRGKLDTIIHVFFLLNCGLIKGVASGEGWPHIGGQQRKS